jgi:hypothetical protein
MSAFNTCYKWAEENSVQGEDILTLKRLQERQKVIDFFFVKTKWNEAVNVELMDKNSQYTFMYVK